MASSLKVLIAEDSAEDAELLAHALREAGFEFQWERVDCEADYLARLRAGPDLVLADFQMPLFSGLRALDLLTQSGLEIPFILVSGNIGEDTAVLAMQHGAADYLLKDRLARLGVAVAQALEQSRLRRERQAAEVKLRESAASLAIAQEVGNFGSWELDLVSLTELSSNPLRWSDQCARIFGFAPGETEITYDRFFSFVHADDRETLKSAVGVAIKNRQRYFVEHRIVLRTGEVRHVFEAGQVFFDAAANRPVKLVGTLHDITEWKQTEVQLERERRLLRTLIDQIPDEIYVKDPNSRFALANLATARALGVASPDDVVGRSDHDFMSADLAEKYRATDLKVMAGQPLIDNEDEISGRGGSREVRLVSKLPLVDPAGVSIGLVGIGRDITARKEAEAALRESEERFRQVVENIHEVFWMRDLEKNRMLYVSPGYDEIWGRPAAELYAASDRWQESIHVDDRERILTATSRQLAGNYDETFRIVRPDGAVRWLRDRAFPVKDAQGKISRIVGVAEDVTERIKLEDQFLRAQRLEAIGTLSGGIAHDLNNILAPMMMVAPLLKGKLDDPHDRELLTIVEQGAQRGANIIKQLLTFSRGIEGERGLVQSRHLLKEMGAIMQETFPREITIVETAATGLWPVMADATQLHQVLMNLCVNARDAMRQGGKLTLSARNLTLDAAAVTLHPLAKPGPYVVMTVSDTGEGIPRGNIDRIFEPFFTTKELGKGTGLGLSTVAGIVKSHGGFLTVYSELGRGSSFKVHLPAVVSGEEKVAAAEEDAARGHGELILVVDDEAAIRKMLSMTLEKQGYRVVTAADGREAMTLFLQNRGSVKLVLTDVMMPGMDGVVLIRMLRASEPQLRIIATSGLHDQDRRDELSSLGITSILPKPCGPDQILEAVRDRLAVSK